MTAPVLLMVLVTLSVVVWPGRRTTLGAHHVDVLHDEGEAAARPLGERLRVLAREDPVEVARRAWQRRAWLRRPWRRRAAKGRGEGFEASVLALLDALEPALRAGLTPARAFELVGGTGLASTHGCGPAVGGIVHDASRAAEAGGSVGRVWQRWAEETGSRTLGFVAAAWLLSERTGAPLADAVARAAARTRSELSRRRRVSAAVAGPRATVNVLSALPLVGPLFGLASGLDPAEVYLSSPLVLVAVALGFTLILVGRWWSRRLVGAVLEPS